ncbi:MAG TPA: dienelactone hydrolase family protein [Ilumatobacter sp.]|jgi:carboxymethylenebutenolidase|nr:dienelactone hydrolase family protein [Ilumatobacter sp.]
MTKLTAADGHAFDVYEVRPDDAAAAIVVIQEIFGVNEHIRSVVDRYASFGYHAVAPALFDRVKRGVELEYDGDGVAEGRQMAAEIRWQPAMHDLAATVAHVAGTGPVGAIGYCFGGSLAWLSANELPVAAAVGYYGGQIHSLNDRDPAVPTMLHFGELDSAIPLEQVEEIIKEHPDVEVHVYDGAQHGFNCEARGSFHPLSAAIALGRTLEFLVANGVKP